MNSTYVCSGARERRVVNGDDVTEDELYRRIEKIWGKRKHVSRAAIFRTVMDIDPVFKVSGGPGIKWMVGQMKRLKEWFYYGFNRYYNLSNRRISSVGQKLPKDWKTHLSNLICCIDFEHQPLKVNFDSTTVMVPGIEDNNYVNFDHVPVW